MHILQNAAKNYRADILLTLLLLYGSTLLVSISKAAETRLYHPVALFLTWQHVVVNIDGEIIDPYTDLPRTAVAKP